jgi:hypothetical protein
MVAGSAGMPSNALTEALTADCNGRKLYTGYAVKSGWSDWAGIYKHEQVNRRTIYTKIHYPRLASDTPSYGHLRARKKAAGKSCQRPQGFWIVGC